MNRRRRPGRVPASTLAAVAAAAAAAAVAGCTVVPTAGSGTTGGTAAAGPAAAGALVAAGAPRAAAVAVAATAARPPQPANRRPNILMITADDAAPGDLRYLPKTRHAIADRGVRFTDAVAPTPICVPARASLLTGQYTHNHRAYTIDGRGGGYRSFDPHRTLPTWLRTAGYDTLFVGKYLNGYGDTPASATRVEPGWTQWRATVGGSTYNFMHPTMNVNGHLVRYHRYSTYVLSDHANELLIRPRRTARPWFMWVNYVAPHHGGPLESDDPQTRYPKRPSAWVPTTVPAPRDRDTFARLDLPDTPNLFRSGAHSPSSGSPMSALRKRNVREAFQQRVEALQSVDDAVARSVGTLRRTGQLGNTVVMFASDNGWASGQHNIVGKLWEFDDIERIPFVMAGPGIPRHRTVRTTLTNPDVATTIAALAHARPTRPQDGVDILPWLRRGYASRVVPIEAYPVHGGTRPLYTGIREGRWTYVHLRKGRGGEELYDRGSDPWEMHNLAPDPAARTRLRHFRALDETYRGCAGSTCPRPGPSP